MTILRRDPAPGILEPRRNAMGSGVAQLTPSMARKDRVSQLKNCGNFDNFWFSTTRG